MFKWLSIWEFEMASPFLAHGKTAISVNDNIITIKTTGPWNVEYFTSLHFDIVASIQKYTLTDYSVLLVPYGEAIGVSEIMDYHVNFLKQGNTKVIAIDLSSCETPNSTESLCRMAYEAANIEHEFFNNNTEALAWIKKKMK